VPSNWWKAAIIGAAASPWDFNIGLTLAAVGGPTWFLICRTILFDTSAPSTL
jgi:hypothetical protein